MVILILFVMRSDWHNETGTAVLPVVINLSIFLLFCIFSGFITFKYFSFRIILNENFGKLFNSLCEGEGLGSLNYFE